MHFVIRVIYKSVEIASCLEESIYMVPLWLHIT